MYNAQPICLAVDNPCFLFLTKPLEFLAPLMKAEKLTSSFKCHLRPGSPVEIVLYCPLESVYCPQVLNKRL